MGITQRVRSAWQALSGIAAVAKVEVTRKTQPLPSILSPYQRPGQAAAFHSAPKPTAANLRRFAEMPVARRAINIVKDQIASMDWQIRIRRGYDAATVPDAEARMNALRLALEEPNHSDSFRTLWEQVLEDTLVGGFGAVEMKATGDPERPLQLFPVDGSKIEVDPK